MLEYNFIYAEDTPVLKRTQKYLFIFHLVTATMKLKEEFLVFECEPTVTDSKNRRYFCGCFYNFLTQALKIRLYLKWETPKVRGAEVCLLWPFGLWRFILLKLSQSSFPVIWNSAVSPWDTMKTSEQNKSN